MRLPVTMSVSLTGKEQNYKKIRNFSNTFLSLIRINTICQKRSRTYRYYADLLSSIVTAAALSSEKNEEIDNR